MKKLLFALLVIAMIIFCLWFFSGCHSKPKQGNYVPQWIQVDYKSLGDKGWVDVPIIDIRIWADSDWTLHGDTLVHKDGDQAYIPPFMKHFYLDSNGHWQIHESSYGMGSFVNGQEWKFHMMKYMFFENNYDAGGRLLRVHTSKLERPGQVLFVSIYGDSLSIEP